MAVFRSITVSSAASFLALSVGVQATTYLSPAQDILLPASGNASEPLQWLGANSPYFAGVLGTFLSLLQLQTISMVRVIVVEGETIRFAD